MTICNHNSICIDPDCKFYHNISIKDRKIVRKLYDNLVSPNKKEENSEIRKANCKFGQICYNEKCGFKHRLCFTDRMKIVDKFNDAKIEMTKYEKVEKEFIIEPFIISKKNLFECLNLY